MSHVTYEWVKAAHLLGVVFWIAGLCSVYWLLRIHAHAPADTREQLTLMERSLALMMDLAAAVAIGCGLALALAADWFKVNEANRPWLHIKLTVVVLAILPIHGMIRARIKKFGQGKISPIPAWQWSLLLAGVTASILLASTKLQM